MEKPALLGFEGFGFTAWKQVSVIKETPKKYRIKLLEDVRFRGRSLKAGEERYVPKHAIKFV